MSTLQHDGGSGLEGFSPTNGAEIIATLLELWGFLRSAVRLEAWQAGHLIFNTTASMPTTESLPAGNGSSSLAFGGIADRTW